MKTNGAPKRSIATPRRTYTAIFEPVPTEDGGGFHVFIPSLQGCRSQGDSFEEAYGNIVEAALLWIEEEIERGNALPPSDSKMSHPLRAQAVKRRRTHRLDVRQLRADLTFSL